MCLLIYLSSLHSACALLFCHLWPVRLYSIFPHYLTNGTICKRKLLNIKCVFWFSLHLYNSIFPHYLTNGTICKRKLLNIKCVFWFSLHLKNSIFPHYLTNGTICKRKLLNIKCVFWFSLHLKNSIFPHYLTNGTICRWKLLNIKCVFWFSVQPLSEILYILRRIQRDPVKKCTMLFKSSAHYSRQIVLNDNFFFQNNIEEFLNIKRHGNPSSWSQVDGRTDRHDKANSHFSQFWRCT